MPRYNFKCLPCEEHSETIYREVFMSIANFDSQGQVCDKCGKVMQHILGMPAVHADLPGGTFRRKGRIPPKDAKDMEDGLTQHYMDKAIARGDYDEARDLTETVVIDQYRDTKTNKKVHIPVEVPPVKD